MTRALTRDEAFALVDAVMELEDLAVSAAANELPNGDWEFEAIFNSEPDLDALATLTRSVLGGTLDFNAEPLPETDWVAKSLEGLKPVIAGGFYVHGSHEDTDVPAGLVPILIDAGLAFGTGHHETTTGCLEAFELAIRRRHPRRVLDLGTGTGVLAIAIALKLRQQVLATDIDPVATEVAAENAARNDVAHLVDTITAEGFDHDAIARQAPFDFVFANILAGPLKDLAPAMAANVTSGATLILSGILENQATGVVNTYRGHGFVLDRRAIKGDWATLTMRKA